MLVFELNKHSFNRKFNVIGMTNNSIILQDRRTNEEFLCHRKVLNTICKSDKDLPCAIVEREYRGQNNKWLATMFTL